MSDFNEWQRQLEAAAAKYSEVESKGAKPQPSPIDLAVKALCQGFSEADLLATEATEEVALTVRNSTPAFFKRQVQGTESIEEAYEQLLGIADELCETLQERRWEETLKYVEEHIGSLRTAHDSGQMAGLASSVCKSLGRLKTGLERCAGNAVKVPSATADVGELFLLTALSAHELRHRLSEVYDC